MLAANSLELPEQAIREYLWTSAAIVGLMALAAFLIMRLNRWINQPESEVSAGDELARFRQLYESGQLEREEYERIRARLGKQMRKELDLPEAPAKPAAPKAPAPDERIQAEPGSPDGPPEPPAPGSPNG